MVERELRELARRRYLLAWGDNHHPKTFGIQKDYTQWDSNDAPPTKVGTKMLTLVEQSGNQNAPKWEPNSSKVGTKMLTTNTTTTNTTEQIPEETEPHGSGTLRDRFEAKYRAATNKTAVVGELFSLLLGGTPDYRRLGSMAKRLNSGGRLLDLIIDASKHRISDDPHDYLDRMVSNAVKRNRADQVPVVLANGQTVSADAAHRLSTIADLRLGGS